MQALPFIAIGLKAAGPLLQGVAGYRAGKLNKKIDYANAQAVTAQGAEQAMRIRNLARISMGRQIGAQAESGFEVGTGSAIDSLMESATESELDAMDAQHQANSRALAYRLQGNQAKREGKNALISGVIGAASAVASGVQDYATASAGAGS
jgi:hypothetical protein